MMPPPRQQSQKQHYQQQMQKLNQGHLGHQGKGQVEAKQVAAAAQQGVISMDEGEFLRRNPYVLMLSSDGSPHLLVSKQTLFETTLKLKLKLKLGCPRPTDRLLAPSKRWLGRESEWSAGPQ